jgi:hypothetical protein
MSVNINTEDTLLNFIQPVDSVSPSPCSKHCNLTSGATALASATRIPRVVTKLSDGQTNSTIAVQHWNSNS